MKQTTDKKETIFPEPFYYMVFYIQGVKGSAFPFIQTLYSNAEGSLKSLFEKGFSLRRGGWDLRMNQEYSINLHGIESENTHKRVQVINNGTMVVQGALVADFLCWSAGEPYDFKNEKKSYRILPLALIEFTYAAVSAYMKVLKEIDKSILFDKVVCEVGFVGLEDNKFYLVDGTVGSMSINRDEKFWRDGENEFPVYIDPSKFVETGSDENDHDKIGEVAYQIVQKIYSRFGFPEDVIPYVKINNGVKKIDSSAW